MLVNAILSLSNTSKTLILPVVNDLSAARISTVQQIPDLLMFGGTKARRENLLRERFSRGEGVVLLHGRFDTSDALERMEQAIADGSSFEVDLAQVRKKGKKHLVNAHSPWEYRKKRMPFPHSDNPARNHPRVYLERLAEAGLFTKLDFKSTQVIKATRDVAALLPNHLKMGHAFVAELDFTRGSRILQILQRFSKTLFTFKKARKAKAALGEDIPFMVSCRGITEKMLTPEFADKLARRVKREGFDIVGLGLVDTFNPDPAIVQQMWERHGVVVQIRIRSEADKAFWDSQPFPYLGLTSKRHLATRMLEP